MGFNEVALDDDQGAGTQAKPRGQNGLEFERENKKDAQLINQTLMTEDQIDKRVETDQVLSRSMQVTSQYVTNGAVPI